MNWIQIFVTVLFAFNISHHMALNKITQDILDVQLNTFSQNKSLVALLERVDKMGMSVSANFVDIKYVQNQRDEIHLRMAAYENTIN